MLTTSFFKDWGRSLMWSVWVRSGFFYVSRSWRPGPATTALYYTVNKVIRNNRSYIGREFWHAFKTNFRQSTIVWLILLLLYAIMGFDCYVMYQYAKAGVALGKIYIVFAVLMMFATMWAIYLFPYIAQIWESDKDDLKKCGCWSHWEICGRHCFSLSCSLQQHLQFIYSHRQYL